MSRTAGVYVIRCLATGEVYVGSSVNLRARLSEHRSTLRHGLHYNRALQEAWTKYGESSFQIEIVEVVDTPADLGVAECRWIDSLHAREPGSGFNVFSGGRRPDLARRFGHSQMDGAALRLDPRRFRARSKRLPEPT